MVKRRSAGRRGVYFGRIRKQIVELLFNQEVLSRKDVNAKSISEQCGVTTATVYNWLRKFGFDSRNGFKNDKSEEEIGNLIWQTLTGAQIESLYRWAQQEAFTERKAPEKQAYHFSDEQKESLRRARERIELEKANAEAKNVAMIAKAGIPEVNATPVPENAKTQADTLANRLHNFVTTNSSTAKQVDNLFKGILFGAQAQTEAVQAMLNQANNDNQFNAKQWAFNELCQRFGKQTFGVFKDAVKNDISKTGDPQVDELLNAYRQNKKSVSLNLVPVGD